MKSKGFTIVELVFVIVILGILASVAVPRIILSKAEAQITKGRADVATIRSAIVLDKNKQMMTGSNSYTEKLDESTPNTDGAKLFEKVLQTPVYSKKSGNEPAIGHWLKTGKNEYSYKLAANKIVAFTYDKEYGTFNCNRNDPNCKEFD